MFISLLRSLIRPSQYDSINNSSNDTDSDDDEYCTPDLSLNVSEICDYVKSSDACGGGGYLEWTSFVFCCEDVVDKWLIVSAGVIFLLILFLFISTSADDFFSPNVSSIVAHLNISENVAGVTFMAFGNGSPDIFASIASVLSSPQPKAGLAIGELLGGAIFVTLMVTSAIVLARPFKAAFFSSLRDLLFFILTVALILTFFLISNKMEIWEPITFLGIYIIYVLIVIGGEYFNKRRRAKKGSISRDSTNHVPTIQIDQSELDLKEVEEEEEEVKENQTISRKGTMSGVLRRLSAVGSVLMGTDNGIFEEDPENDDDDFVVKHNKVYHGSDARLRANTIVPPKQVHGVKDILIDLWNQLKPFQQNEDDEEELTTFGKVKSCILWPVYLCLKLTIPLSEAPWSKPIAIIHSILSPQCFLFCIQELLTVPIEGGPGLYAYVPVLSILIIIFLVIFTEFNSEPRFYKSICAYTGFLMSVGWIYFISAEVVDVVDMLGVVSGINQAVLGMTIIAWSNSIGDLIADISVARQGFPRMAMAASIGGPLFNVLIGFGLPFTISKIQGHSVTMDFSGVNIIMITFLSISLIFSTVHLVIFRARMTRPYGIILILIYIAFLVFVVLEELDILNW